jgi:hypothetical protein
MPLRGITNTLVKPDCDPFTAARESKDAIHGKRFFAGG